MDSLKIIIFNEKDESTLREYSGIFNKAFEFPSLEYS